MQLESELGVEAGNVGASSPPPGRRKAKPSRKVTVRVTEKLYDQLAVATDRPGVGKSMVVQAALANFLNPTSAAEHPAQRRIEDLHDRFDSLEGNLRTIAETVALHARYHLAVMPPLPEHQQPAACGLGDARFKVLAEQVDRRVRENRPLMQETIKRLESAMPEFVSNEDASEGPEPAVRRDFGSTASIDHKAPLPPGKVRAIAASATGGGRSASSDRKADVAKSYAARPAKIEQHMIQDYDGAERPLKNWRLILAVFLPFTAGYYLSFLFRTINAAISPALIAEFNLNAAEVGLLASVYFLVFAGAQLPIGVLLDRYGPRRVQGVLLVLAAGGTSWFGTASGFSELLTGRALIGLGVAASLMAGLKAIVIWFPRERIALVNGSMIMLGSLGAVTATAPTDWLLEWAGWRSLFELLTLATVAIAGLVYWAVPEKVGASASRFHPDGQLTVWSVLSDVRFLRIAPLSATCIGSSWALQSLWAAPWLSDVEGLDRPSLMTQLLIMALSLSVGALVLGILADRLRKRGIAAETLLAIVGGLFIAAELALILRAPVPSFLPWCVVAMTGAATVLSYAAIAEYFPQQIAARANGALNLVHFGWAFAIQFGIGIVVAQWIPLDGHYPATAYQVAFGLGVVFQAIALLWFAVPWLKRLITYFFVSPVRPPADRGTAPATMPIQSGVLAVHEAAEW